MKVDLATKIGQLILSMDKDDLGVVIDIVRMNADSHTETAKSLIRCADRAHDLRGAYLCAAECEAARQDAVKWHAKAKALRIVAKALKMVDKR